MVHEDDLPKFYRASRIFTLVSDRGKGRGEGIPLTPLEAMACGSPIIVGNQDGSQELPYLYHLKIIGLGQTTKCGTDVSKILIIAKS